MVADARRVQDSRPILAMAVLQGTVFRPTPGRMGLVLWLGSNRGQADAGSSVSVDVACQPSTQHAPGCEQSDVRRHMTASRPLHQRVWRLHRDKSKSGMAGQLDLNYKKVCDNVCKGWAVKDIDCPKGACASGSQCPTTSRHRISSSGVPRSPGPSGRIQTRTPMQLRLPCPQDVGEDFRICGSRR